MPKTLTRAFLPVAICFWISACDMFAKEADVPGTYVVRHAFATETLIMAPSREFSQEVRLHDTDRVFTTRGKWSFESHGAMLVMDDWLLLGDGLGKGPRPRYWEPERGLRLSVQKQILTGRISIRADDYVVYRKVGPEADLPMRSPAELPGQRDQFGRERVH